MSKLSRQAERRTRFDNIARSLAGAGSRRSALRALATGFGGMALAGLGIKNSWAASNCLCNNRVYDSDTACCTPSGIVAKHPIADLAACANRVRNTSHVCAPNGCGGAGSWVTPPQSYFGVSFVPACNAHDCCYDRCNASKAGCDTDFHTSLTAICNAAFPGTGWAQDLKRGGCISQGDTYYDFVNARGQPFYDQAQRASCDCCGTETCRTCAGGSCGALPACAGGGDCVCFTTPQGQGVCIHGNTPCAGLSTCASNADCPPGYGCAATSCCGGGAVCGPLCSDISPARSRSVAPSGATMGG